MDVGITRPLVSLGPSGTVCVTGMSVKRGSSGEGP